MARIRTIKPEFWTNEDLSALPEATHMLAAALLNYADDHGYFNANPGLIKSACSPLREPSVSIHDSIKQLQEIDYIRVAKGRDGKTYGWVVKFDEHQRVNRPTQSKIKDLATFTEASVSHHEQRIDDALPEGNREQGKERKEKSSGSTAVDPPDGPAGDSPDDLGGSAPKSEPIPAQRIVDRFNARMEGLSKVREMNPKRQSLIRAAWRAGPQRRSIEFWDAYFEECQADPFLNGSGPYRPPHENWRPTFDYLMHADTITKVYERALDRLERNGATT